MTIRIGILSTAAISDEALLQPAAANTDVAITAVASRDAERADAYAVQHGIATSYASYEELLAADDIDAIYNPLPIGMHGQWTIKALEAGKHVLCEKALTANAEEAERVRDAQQAAGLVMMQAFHNRYHSMLGRIQQVLASGELGALTHLEADFDVPRMPAGDIRWNYELAGGVTPDIGVYPIDLVRVLAGRQPTVISATALASPHDPRVDATLEAHLDFGDGLTGRVRGTMGQGGEPRQSARVTGEAGTLDIDGFVHPQRGNQLTLIIDGHERAERVAAQPSSYAAQLTAFVAAVRDGAPYVTDATDAIATMQIIDDCYRAAGLPLRVPTP